VCILYAFHVYVCILCRLFTHWIFLPSYLTSHSVPLGCPYVLSETKVQCDKCSEIVNLINVLLCYIVVLLPEVSWSHCRW
jgi:hypothetical protein